MLRRSKSLLAIPVLIVLLLSSGCGQGQLRTPGSRAQTLTPGAAATTAAVPVTAGTASPGARTTGAGAPLAASQTAVGEATGTLDVLPSSSVDTLKAANTCTLINSSDLAHLFPPHNEITRQPPKTSPISQPAFSDDTQVHGKETTCVFFDFHEPGKQTGWMLQVTYLVDTPDPSAVQAWRDAWASAKAESGEPVSGLGDDAFADGGSLYIKKGDAYLTFISYDTHVDEKTKAGQDQLLEDNKQLAAAAITRMK